MFNFLSTSLLADRLDAEFYSEDQIKNQQLLVDYGSVPFESLCTAINVGFTGELTSVYVNSGVPLYRVSDIDDVFLNESDVNYVPNDFAKENPQIAIRDGDLVLAAVGNTIGKAAIKGKNITHGVCSRALMIARPKHEAVDAYFLISHIATKFGQKSLLRGVSGSAQPVLNTPLIAGIPIPKIESLCQKYIGDKVRQAEWLRAWAKVGSRIPALIDAILVGEIPERLVSEIVEAATSGADEGLRSLRQALAEGYLEGKFAASLVDAIGRNAMGSVDVDRENFHVSMVKVDDIDDFLSAQTYRPPIISAYSAVTTIKHCKLQNLCIESIRQGATPHFSEVGKKCIKSKQTRDICIEEEGYETVDPSHEKNERIIKLRENDVLVTRQGAGTVGRASIFLDSEETYITDSLFLVRVDPVKADPGFIAAYLRSYTGQRLIEKGVYGSTGQLNLSSAALRNLPVADFDICLQRVLGDQIRVSDKATKIAKRLTFAAKLLVEALIEGQLTETELIAAEQALQVGNDQLDRRILNRLKTDGVDGQGQALFADLDELYHLLKQAEGD